MNKLLLHFHWVKETLLHWHFVTLCMFTPTQVKSKKKNKRNSSMNWLFWWKEVNIVVVLFKNWKKCFVSVKQNHSIPDSPPPLPFALFFVLSSQFNTDTNIRTKSEKRQRETAVKIRNNFHLLSCLKFATSWSFQFWNTSYTFSFHKTHLHPHSHTHKVTCRWVVGERESERLKHFFHFQDCHSLDSLQEKTTDSTGPVKKLRKSKDQEMRHMSHTWLYN